MTRDVSADAGHGLIRVRVRDISQLFNSLDPDPFIERDLDDDAAKYIESWAREIPPNKQLRLVVEVTEPKSSHGQQEIVEAAVRNYFGHMAELSRNQFRELMRRGRASLLIGLCALAACFAAGHMLGELLSEYTWGVLVRECLLIGGWVAMWRPLEIFLYDWWPLRGDRKDYERLRDMKVEVVLPAAPH